MPTNKKTTQEEKNEHWKVYNFFSQGEFLTSIQARNKKQAIENFKEEGFEETDYDMVIGYEHFTRRYFVGVDLK